MKKFILLTAIVFSGIVGTFAQQTSNEGYVGASFLRQDVKFTKPSFKIDENTDSFGVTVGGTHFLNGSFVGVTGDATVNFDSKEASLLTVMGGGMFKNRAGKFAQPYVRLMGGIGRQHVNRKNITQTIDYSFAWDAGAGIDFNLGANSRFKVRTGVDLVNSGFNGARNTGARLTTALVF